LHRSLVRHKKLQKVACHCKNVYIIFINHVYFASINYDDDDYDDNDDDDYNNNNNILS